MHKCKVNRNTVCKKSRLGHTDNRVAPRILVANVQKKKKTTVHTCCNAHWRGRVLFIVFSFGAAQGGSPFPWFKPEIPPCCPSTQDCQLHCQHSRPLFHSCNGSVAIQRVRSKFEQKKTCQQQSRHAHLDDRCVGKKNSLEEHVLVFPKAPDCHRFRKISFVDVNLVFH